MKQGDTLQGTNISDLWKKNIIFKSAFKRGCVSSLEGIFKTDSFCYQYLSIRRVAYTWILVVLQFLPPWSLTAKNAEKWDNLFHLGSLPSFFRGKLTVNGTTNRSLLKLDRAWDQLTAFPAGMATRIERRCLFSWLKMGHIPAMLVDPRGYRN